MLVAHFFILAAHLGDLAQIEREPQRIQRRTPQLAVGHGAAEHGERVGLLAGIGGALVGDVGGGRGALQQEGALAGILGPDLENGAGQPQPVAAVVRRHRRNLAEDLQPGAEIAALEGGVGVGSQARARLGDRTRLALDLRRQLDGRIGQIVALEGLIGRLGCDEAKRQRGAKCCGANQTNHDGAPWARTSAAFRTEVREKVTDSWRGKWEGNWRGNNGSKISHDIAEACPLRRRRVICGANIALRADLTQRSTVPVGRFAAGNGSEMTWPEADFFILAML